MDRVIIRKIGGSLYFKFPFTYKHKFDLKEGDLYDLLPNKDGSFFKLIKVDEAESGERVERVEQSVEGEVNAA